MTARGLSLLVGVLLALVSTSTLASEKGTYLRMHGFGVNYGLTGETPTGPRPPEFHLNLKLHTIFSEPLTTLSDQVIAGYVQRTIERVFSELVGTDEQQTPFAMPTYRLVSDRSAH